MTVGANSDTTSGGGAVLLLASDRIDVPWRNGGGTTTVVASSAAGAGSRSDIEPDWRVSIATISRAGAFSVFPGVDRVLMPLSPDGLTLEIGGRIRDLARYDTVEFAGEEAVAAVDVASPGDDLNLMTTRGVCEGSVVVRLIDDVESFTASADETVLLVVVEGEFSSGVSGADGPLMNRDAVMLPSGVVAELVGRGRVAVITVLRNASE